MWGSGRVAKNFVGRSNRYAEGDNPSVAFRVIVRFAPIVSIPERALDLPKSGRSFNQSVNGSFRSIPDTSNSTLYIGISDIGPSQESLEVVEAGVEARPGRPQERIRRTVRTVSECSTASGQDTTTRVTSSAVFPPKPAFSIGESCDPGR